MGSGISSEGSVKISQIFWVYDEAHKDIVRTLVFIKVIIIIFQEIN